MMNIFTGKFEPNSSVSAGPVSQQTSSPGRNSRRNSTLPGLYGSSSQADSKEFHGKPLTRKFSVQSPKANYGSRQDAYYGEFQPKPSTLYPVLNDPYLRGKEMREFVTEDEEESGSEKVKLKLMSIWNNVKYGWSVTMKPTFSNETPIWFLGQLYHQNMIDSFSHSHSRQTRTSHDDASVQKSKETALNLFQQDYYSRIWLTYRKNFVKIEGSSLTTDCGWGCMLRSGQMMMAQAFITHYLTRGWRFRGSQSDKNDMIHRMIIKWFLDEPHSPFSLHNLVKIGAVMGRKPGDWYGPSTAVHVLTQALAEAAVDNPVMESICAYVAQDCTVYIDDIVKLCTESISSRRSASLLKKEARNRASSHASINSNNEMDWEKITRRADAMTFDHLDDLKDVLKNTTSRSSRSFLNSKAASTINLYDGNRTDSVTTSGYASVASDHESMNPIPSGAEGSEKWRGVVIFIPVRLGGEKFNPVYTSCVKALFAHPSTLGIIGGRPRHSLFFVGCQEDKLIYLDPHLCQDAVGKDQVNFPLQSFHCGDPRKLSINKMDPSCTIAFYCRTRQEFFDLIVSVKDFIVPGQRHTDYPIFVFAEGSSKPYTEIFEQQRTERVVRTGNPFMASSDDVDHAEQLTDDFVLIS